MTQWLCHLSTFQREMHDIVSWRAVKKKRDLPQTVRSLQLHRKSRGSITRTAVIGNLRAIRSRGSGIRGRVQAQTDTSTESLTNDSTVDGHLRTSKQGRARQQPVHAWRNASPSPHWELSSIDCALESASILKKGLDLSAQPLPWFPQSLTLTTFQGRLDSLSQGSARQRISLSSSKPQPAYNDVSARPYRLSKPNPAVATKLQYYKLFSTANQFWARIGTQYEGIIIVQVEYTWWRVQWSR
ncbi:hypothetical protein DFH08DRAFT_813993 [Mycena albidolilacea]|uniref:Uncharacterized protein n=1 Tax=Mycena albidolilacea TaxID=1033008 RepID=A0AAD6ZRI4_9AGAR|nr:hypothetical protein DFH08DRAFT_813993 [Mycena albidolilacea]